MDSTTLEIIFFIVNLVLAAFVGFGTATYTIGQYKNKVDTLEKEKDKSCDKIDVLRTDVDTLKEFKVQTQKYIDSKIYKSESPLSLTEFGTKLLKDSGFNEVFDLEKDNLVGKLEKYNSRNKYDIQENARDLMNSLVEYLPFASIKTYAFSNGIDFSQILRAGAIPLRDYYFEKHPEITE